MSDVIPYAEKIGALTIEDTKAQVALVQQVLREVMKEGEHYGKIPGIDKPTLFKAGAEKLCLVFRLDPQYETVEKQEGVHLTITSKCTLWHIPSGQRFGSGMGSCSTRESRYAYRHGQRKCPKCGAEAIIKGKDFKNDGLPTGWLCYRKKDGCGAKFLDGDESIEKQVIGRVANEDIPDQYNTVLKMSNKRSLVAAILNTTAASDLLTQDVEDMPHHEPSTAAAPASAHPSPSGEPAAAAAGLRLTAPQILELGAALYEKDAKRVRLLSRATKDYGEMVSRLAQIKQEDFADALKYAKAT